jgi:membrane-associated phospholipid phosphatase
MPVIGASAQEPETFYRASDIAWVGAFSLASYGVSRFDPRVTKYFQQRKQQLDPTMRGFANVFTRIQETTLTLAGLATYGVARLTHAQATSEVALHATEAIVATSLTSQVIRGPLGRARPKDATPKFEDQYEFHWFKGFGHFEYRAFPSIHSASAFAAATSVVIETRYRSPKSNAYVAPIAYLLAAGPGFARVYLGQHWTSDIVMGAFMGTFYGSRIVEYSHQHPDNSVDRFFLGTRAQNGLSIVPRRGGFSVGYGESF